MPRGRPKGSAVPSGALERMIYEIGQRLGEALVRGLEHTVSKGGRGAARPTLAKSPGRPRASSSSNGCSVPSCARDSVARGLCATHYRKARRLNMGEPLSNAQLNELSQDGRKNRKAA